MSSLFSYELDEAQIRLTLQNSKAVEYNESSWDDFESNFVQNSSNQSHTRFKLPEFNLNINRNVVLPVIFIAALVGVSAIMLSFVDFKTNTPTQVEKGLIPNPNNYKPEQTKTAVVVKKEPVKTVVEKPIVKKDSIPVKVENPIISPTTQVAVNTNPASQTTDPVQNTIAKTSISDNSSDTKNDNSTIISPNIQSNNGKKRKRRRKVPTEQIETIKAPSILSQEETATKEPELELKLN